MLTLLLLIPLLGSLIILPMSNTLENKRAMKKIALTSSLLNFFISLNLWYLFDSSSAALGGGQFQFVSEFNQLNFCHLNFGVDGLSLYFVLLTTFVTPIALLSNYTNINKNLKLFLISILVLETLQICAFVSLDLLLFYIFFESVKCFGSALVCLQLSNSGDNLKLMIPSYILKNICGQNNYLGKVTSHQMSENEMGYRGSKSPILYREGVKEQRVDGSYFINKNLMKLRCTLMGFERNYQISNPSNQFIKNFRFFTKMPSLNRGFYTNNFITFSNNNCLRIALARPLFSTYTTTDINLKNSSSPCLSGASL